ncbi:TPA: hypothetical protein ACQ8RW_004857, partial [Escherichia coli]
RGNYLSGLHFLNKVQFLLSVILVSLSFLIIPHRGFSQKSTFFSFYPLTPAPPLSTLISGKQACA